MAWKHRKTFRSKYVIDRTFLETRTQKRASSVSSSRGLRRTFDSLYWRDLSMQDLGGLWLSYTLLKRPALCIQHVVTTRSYALVI